jgi:hypothetical protein
MVINHHLRITRLGYFYERAYPDNNSKIWESTDSMQLLDSVKYVECHGDYIEDPEAKRVWQICGRKLTELSEVSE